MHTVSGKSLSVGILSATILATLLLVPIASRAQTFFGSGGSTNSAPGVPNLAFGYQTLYSNTSGQFNTALGSSALYSNTIGTWNTATGMYALYSNTTGSLNMANGYDALYYNTTGTENTALGSETLLYNTTGSNNTANGTMALYSNTTGASNTATGSTALYYNTTGQYNTANGFQALNFNTIGQYNTASGSSALYSNTTGSSNTASGVNALYYNTGQYNTANGVGALYRNSTGNNNVADGYFALLNSTTGSSNIALGNGAGNAITTSSNNIIIGNTGTGSDSGIIRIGTKGAHTQTFIAGISGVAASGGVAVYINANGQLGTLTSSQRFKYDIQDMGAKSDKLMDLRPVMFRYKEAAEDGTHPVQYGLIAEEVAKVYPDLVQYDKQGKPFTVYYHLLTPMMLNDLQKAHQEINSLKAGQQSQSAALQTQVTSLQQTVHMQFMAFTAFVLVFLALVLGGAAYVIAVRTHRFPSWRVGQIEKCAS